MKKFLVYVFLIFLFFSGCANKRYIAVSKSYKIGIKLKNIAFSDLGFLKQGSDYSDLELFDAGNLVLKMEVDKDEVCVNSHCFGKKEFNKRFLCEKYSQNLLDNVLNKRVIFNKEGYKAVKNGFIQLIKRDGMEIKYIVSHDKIYFKDRKNHIFIKLRELNE